MYPHIDFLLLLPHLQYPKKQGPLSKKIEIIFHLLLLTKQQCMAPNKPYFLFSMMHHKSLQKQWYTNIHLNLSQWNKKWTRLELSLLASQAKSQLVTISIDLEYKALKVLTTKKIEEKKKPLQSSKRFMKSTYYLPSQLKDKMINLKSHYQGAKNK